jgi:hypothetical protein
MTFDLSPWLPSPPFGRQAVALALKHEEETVRKLIGYDAIPTTISMTTPALTSSTQDNNTDDDSDSDSENDTSGVSPSSLLQKKQPERKTRTQRNKEKNRSLRQYELHQRQKEKRFLKSIHNAPKVAKEIEKVATEQEIKRVALQNLIKQTKEEEDQQLTYAEAGVVPLTDELNGSLRMIKPKGVAVVEQVNSMVKSGDMMAKNRRRRRQGEYPFGPRKVKWIPKYKYGI